MIILWVRYNLFFIWKANLLVMGCAGSKNEKENKTQPTLNHANVPVNTPPIDHHPIK